MDQIKSKALYTRSSNASNSSLNFKAVEEKHAYFQEGFSPGMKKKLTSYSEQKSSPIHRKQSDRLS